MTETEIQSFIAQGFVRIDAAFARETADAARAILWAATGCDSNDPATWKKAVIRLGDCGQQPFSDAVNTPVLHGRRPEELRPSGCLTRPIGRAARKIVQRGVSRGAACASARTGFVASFGAVRGEITKSATVAAGPLKGPLRQ